MVDSASVTSLTVWRVNASQVGINGITAVNNYQIHVRIALPELVSEGPNTCQLPLSEDPCFQFPDSARFGVIRGSFLRSSTAVGLRGTITSPQVSFRSHARNTVSQRWLWRQREEPLQHDNDREVTLCPRARYARGRRYYFFRHGCTSSLTLCPASHPMYFTHPAGNSPTGECMNQANPCISPHVACLPAVPFRAVGAVSLTSIGGTRETT